MDEPGSSPDRRYQRIEKLAHGGMGEVWLGRDVHLDREVAIKIVRGDHEDEGIAERFGREVQALAQCTHPGIVSLYDFGIEDGAPFLVMERVHGETLAQRVERDGPLPPHEVARIGVAVAEALAHAHERGVLHRDVTPANVLIASDGHPRLVDFGLVRGLGSPTSELSTDTILGTPSYTAPEQAFGAPDEVDGRVDVYGLGATLFFALTGRAPFVAPTLLALLRQIEEAPVPEAGVGAEWDVVLERALAKVADERFASAGEFGAALVALRDGVNEHLALGGARAIEAEPRGGREVVSLLVGVFVGIMVTLWIRTGQPVDSPLGPTYRGESGTPEAADTPTWLLGVVPSAATSDPDEVEELVNRGAFGALRERPEFQTAYAWTMLSLGTATNLVRYVAPGWIDPDFEPPVDPAPGSLAAAALATLHGDWEEALELVDALRAGEGASPLSLDYVEAHAMLLQTGDDFDRERAGVLLARLPTHRAESDPFLASGLSHALRARVEESDEVGFYWFGRPEPSHERIIAFMAWMIDAGCCDAAVAWVGLDATDVEAVSAQDREILLVLHAYSQVLAAIEVGMEFEVEDLVDELEALSEESSVWRLAQLVLACDALQHEDLGRAVELIDECRSDDEELDADSLPAPIGGVIEALEESESWQHAALREFYEAFGYDSLARDQAATLAELEAEDVEDEDDRRKLLIDNAIARARLSRFDDQNARLHLIEAMDMGATPERVREEVYLRRLFRHPEIAERLGR